MAAVYKAGPQVESSLWPMSLLTAQWIHFSGGLCMETESESVWDSDCMRQTTGT